MRWRRPAPQRAEDLVALHEALERLAGFDPRRSQVIELSFFGSLSVEETAVVLKVSRHRHARPDTRPDLAVQRVTYLDDTSSWRQLNRGVRLFGRVSR